MIMQRILPRLLLTHIPRQLLGSNLSPFLWIGVISPWFQILGKIPELRMMFKSFSIANWNLLSVYCLYIENEQRDKVLLPILLQLQPYGSSLCGDSGVWSSQLLSFPLSSVSITRFRLSCCPLSLASNVPSPQPSCPLLSQASVSLSVLCLSLCLSPFPPVSLHTLSLSSTSRCPSLRSLHTLSLSLLPFSFPCVFLHRLSFSF